MTIVAAHNAIIYARRSMKQKKATSVPDQVAGGREACDDNGWDVVEVIDQDDDRSASRFVRKDRPGWDQLLSALRAGAGDVVVLWETSRGDRKLSEWSVFLDLCRDRGILIHVVSHDRTYDLRKARDWKVMAEDGVNSAMESEILSQRVKRGKRSAARKGEPYPVPPYGLKAVYDVDTGERTGWVKAPERAEITREIILRVGKHESLKAIKRDLDGRSVPTARGAGWTEQQIRHMAMNPAYAGLLRLDDGTLIDGNWPAIVTRAEWNDAMAVLGPRKTGRRPGSQQHLLTYLAVCSCGAPLVFRRPNGNLRYTCKKGCFYIAEEWLDQLVTDVICERLSRDDARDLFNCDDERADQLRNEIAELQGQLDEWLAANISARAYEIKEAQLQPVIIRKRDELEALEVPPALKDILSADNVRAAWDGYTVQARRAIIAAVTGVEVVRGPAPDWVPTEAVRGKVWVRFTGEPFVKTK